jgi:aryl-alcohol dehydrogenase-like predicted oxidoreductase
MQRRPFGSTGEQVSLLGMGGFHLLEIDGAMVTALANAYLDAGGNYLESAFSYGNGASERKIARAVGHRRGEYLLATKTTARTKAEALAELEGSLRHLGTDYVDVWYLHAVQDAAIAEAVLAPDGAAAAQQEAIRAGKVRFAGITGHGQPAGLLHALARHPFDAVMTQVNYYDDGNFPDVQRRLLPLARERGMAVVAMKPLGDGYLHRSPTAALRYALSQPVAMAVAGFNSPAMLAADLAAVAAFTPLDDATRADLLRDAPEFRGYACRQCADCPVPTPLDLRRIFELEGWADRQMGDGTVGDAAEFALRMRLCRWFGNGPAAADAYAAEGHAVDPHGDYTALSAHCRYGLDLDRKLKLAHAKLTGTEPAL